MKIAMFGHKRIPSREGGIEVVIEELSTRMALLGHEVTLYSRKGHNVAGKQFDSELFMQDEYDYKGVKVKQVSTLDFKGLAAVTSSYAAMEAAIADKPDVIHVHAEGPSAMLYKAKKAGIKTVVTIHGLDWQRAKWGPFGRAYIKHGERCAAKLADELIVLSENMQRYFCKTYNRETVLIPNGVSVKDKKDARIIKQKYGLTKDSYILFLGRIVPEKGVHYLLDAFANTRTEKKLVIAGGSSDSDEYVKKIKKMAANDDRVILSGFVEGRELEEFYSNCSFYVLPSDLEGMPLSLLEAMSYGCCCLVSDIDECASVIGDSGIVFHKGSVEDLQKKIQGLLQDGSRKYFGETARNRVMNLCKWDTVVARTLDLYK